MWDATNREILEVEPSSKHVRAIDCSAKEFPLLALARGPQTVIEHAGTGQPIASFPVALEHITVQPGGHTWAGSVGNGVYLLTLEGQPPSETAPPFQQQNSLLAPAFQEKERITFTPNQGEFQLRKALLRRMVCAAVSNAVDVVLFLLDDLDTAYREADDAEGLLAALDVLANLTETRGHLEAASTLYRLIEERSREFGDVGRQLKALEGLSCAGGSRRFRCCCCRSQRFGGHRPQSW